MAHEQNYEPFGIAGKYSTHQENEDEDSTRGQVLAALIWNICEISLHSLE